MRLTRRSILKGALAAGAAAAASSPGPADAREKVEPEPGAVGLLYDSTRCVGCQTCVGACKEANHLPPDPEPKELDCNTKSVVKTRQLSKPIAEGATTAFVKRQCMQCVDPSCVSACLLGAMHKEGRGKKTRPGERAGTGVVLYDQDLCLGCRYCQIACAYAVPKFQWSEAAPRIVKCELCHGRADPSREGPQSVANPACAEACPVQAVIFGYRRDLLAEAKSRLKAEPGKYNPKIFGEHDGGGTQVLYLAAAGVEFGELGFPDMPLYSPASLSETVTHRPYLHGLTPIALYAAAAFLVTRHRKRAANEPTPAQGAPHAVREEDGQ